MALPLTRADVLFSSRNYDRGGAIPSSLESWSTSPDEPNGPGQTVREMGDANWGTQEIGGADLPEVVKQVLGARLEREVPDVELRVAAATATAWARIHQHQQYRAPAQLCCCAGAALLLSPAVRASRSSFMLARSGSSTT